MSLEKFEIQLLDECSDINIYTIHRVGESDSEFQKFAINHKDNSKVKKNEGHWKDTLEPSPNLRIMFVLFRLTQER